MNCEVYRNSLPKVNQFELCSLTTRRLLGVHSIRSGSISTAAAGGGGGTQSGRQTNLLFNWYSGLNHHQSFDLVVSHYIHNKAHHPCQLSRVKSWFLMAPPLSSVGRVRAMGSWRRKSGNATIWRRRKSVTQMLVVVGLTWHRKGSQYLLSVLSTLFSSWGVTYTWRYSPHMVLLELRVPAEGYMDESLEHVLREHKIERFLIAFWTVTAGDNEV